MVSAVTVVRRMIRQIVTDLQSDSPPMDAARAKENIKQHIADLARQDYLRLSRGEMTDEGLSWQPTIDGEPILIKTGNLFDSLRSDWIGNKITVSFDETQAPYAEFATAKRPLWRERYPSRWILSIRSKMTTEISNIIRSRATKVKK